MSLINNDRDMQNFLCDLRFPGEFTAKDLADIALALPVSVLAAALYANAGAEEFVRADTHGKKADVIARVLHCWCLNPELRLGQLVSILSCSKPAPSDMPWDPFYVEDGVIAERADALAGTITLRTERKPEKT